jgi:hypothetical protein
MINIHQYLHAFAYICIYIYICIREIYMCMIRLHTCVCVCVQMSENQRIMADMQKSWEQKVEDAKKLAVSVVQCIVMLN